MQFSQFQLFAIGTFGFQPSYLILITVYFLLLKKNLWDESSFSLPKTFFPLGLVLICITVGISGLTPFLEGNNAHITQFIKSSAHFLFVVTIAILLMISDLKRNTFTIMIKTWLVIALLINIFGIYQMFARGFDLPFAWLEVTNVSYTVRGDIDTDDLKQLSLKYGNFFRATSIFSEPSYYASFNVYTLTFLIVPFIQRKKQFFSSVVFNVISFSLALVGAFLTFSLTAALGLFMLMGALFIFEKKKQFIAVIPIFLASIVILLFVDGIVEKYTTVSVAELFKKRVEGLYYLTKGREHFTYGETVGTRSENARKSYEIWKENPINGCGLGLTGYQKKYALGYSDFTILAMLAEQGILGFIVFNLLFIALFYYTRKMLKNKDDPDIDEDKQVLFGMGFYIMVHLFELNYITMNHSSNQMLWVPIAMLLGILRIYYITYGKEMIVVNNFKVSPRTSFKESLKSYIMSRQKN
jgi:hypothetical protein